MRMGLASIMAAAAGVALLGVAPVAGNRAAAIMPSETRKRFGLVQSRKGKRKAERRQKLVGTLKRNDEHRRTRRPLGFSNPFTRTSRRLAFDHLIAEGVGRNEAMKRARRVAA